MLQFRLNRDRAGIAANSVLKQIEAKVTTRRSFFLFQPAKDAKRNRSSSSISSGLDTVCATSLSSNSR